MRKSGQCYEGYESVLFNPTANTRVMNVETFHGSFNMTSHRAYNAPDQNRSARCSRYVLKPMSEFIRFKTREKLHSAQTHFFKRNVAKFKWVLSVAVDVLVIISFSLPHFFALELSSQSISCTRAIQIQIIPANFDKISQSRYQPNHTPFFCSSFMETCGTC